MEDVALAARPLAASRAHREERNREGFSAIELVLLSFILLLTQVTVSYCI